MKKEKNALTGKLLQVLEPRDISISRKAGEIIEQAVTTNLQMINQVAASSNVSAKDVVDLCVQLSAQPETSVLSTLRYVSSSYFLSNEANRAFKYVIMTGLDSDVIRTHDGQTAIGDPDLNPDLVLSQHDECAFITMLSLANYPYKHATTPQVQDYWQLLLGEILSLYGGSLLPTAYMVLSEAVGVVSTMFDSAPRIYRSIIRQSTLSPEYKHSLINEHAAPVDKKRGITHLEDLDDALFHRAINDLELCVVTEKLDGSNMRFGVENGQMYTVFGNLDKVYSVDEHPENFSSNYRIFAHRALLTRESEVTSLGDFEIEVEVLYDEIPNVIRYDDTVNDIVLLRQLKGDPHILPKVAEIYESNGITSVEHDCLVSRDGNTALKEKRTSKVMFSEVPQMSQKFLQESLAKSDLSTAIEQYNAILGEIDAETGMSVSEVANFKLNGKRPEDTDQDTWNSLKQKVKDSRNPCRDKIKKAKQEVKKHLLSALVHSSTSKFSDREDSWIEGIVIKHPDGFMFKIVDKATFLEAKNFIWQKREEIKSTVLNNKNDSLVGKTMLELAHILGDTRYATISAKRVIRSQAETPDKFLKLIKGSLDVAYVKEKFIDTLTRALRSHQIMLDEYLSTYKSLAITIPNGVDISYADDCIHSRALAAFCEARRKLEALMRITKAASESAQLYRVVLGNRIETAFG